MTREPMDDKPMFEAAGYKVYFTHTHEKLPPMYGPVPGKINYRRQIAPAAKGGTGCHIVSETEAMSEVTRCSMKDNWNRATGRKMAMRKLLIRSFPNRKQRALFWYEYFKALGQITRAYKINEKWHCKPITFDIDLGPVQNT